jgi:subtilisin family serine protease
MLQTRQLTPRHLEYLPGQLVIRIAEPAVRPHLEPTALRMTASSARQLPEAVAEPLDYLRRNAGLREVRPLFSKQRDRVARVSVSAEDRRRLALLSSVADSESEELAGINVVSVDPKKLEPQLLRHVVAAKTVEYAERVPARWAAATLVDPLRNLQWGLRAVGWFGLRIPDASDVRVGVMDSGIDDRHPDLKNVDVTYHHDGLSREDIMGHGTHVSGTISADTNNDVGIAGVARCKLTVWKVFPDKPYRGEFYVDGERLWQALGSAEREGVRVVNLSLGGTAPSQTDRILFDRLQRQGIVVVAAMGNEFEDGNPTYFPAAYDSVVAVGAVAEDRRRAPYSNTGPHIDLVAPGSNVLSTLPTRRSSYPSYRPETSYGAWSGTSMATPHVTAAIALAAARFPQDDRSSLVERLRGTLTKLPAMRGRKRTHEYGLGLLNLVDYLT